MSSIQLVFFDGGGGHRQAALSLKQVLDAQGKHAVRLLNLQELLEPVDVVRRVTGVRMQDVYNGLLRRGWTLGAAHLLKAAQFLIRRFDADALPILEAHWRAERPDLVVSLVPNVNRSLQLSVARTLPASPFVTLLTDLADYPPHFWIEPEPQYFVCGSTRAVEQAVALGHDPSRVFRTTGMIVNPRFYEAASMSRAHERRLLGLSPDKPTALICFGGEGPRTILDIACRLDRSSLDLQLILVCGRNAVLADELRRLPWRIPVHVEGFTREMPFYMQLSDFLIGKPGPGSLSEAFVMGLPAIVDLSAWTLPQERFNAEWIRREGLGLVVGRFDAIVQAVESLLAPSELGRLRRKVTTLNNRAIFEIPRILDAIIARGSVAIEAAAVPISPPWATR